MIADCASVKLPLRKLEQWNCYEITKLYEIAFNQDLLYLYRSFLRTCEKYCIVLAGLDVFCIVHLQIIWSIGFTVTVSFEPLLIIGIWPVVVILWFIGTNSGNSLFSPLSHFCACCSWYLEFFMNLQSPYFGVMASWYWDYHCTSTFNVAWSQI